MTASLPVPREDYPDRPDGLVESAPGESAPIAILPPKPRRPKKPSRSAVQAAKDAASAAQRASAVDPGPPPPLPQEPPPLPQELSRAGIVVPPRPPLPAPAPESAAPESADEFEDVEDAPPEVVEDAEPEAEPEVVEEPEDADAGPEAVEEPEPEAVEDVADEDRVAAVDATGAEASVVARGVDAPAADGVVVLDDSRTDAVEAAFADEPLPAATGPVVAALSLRGIRKSFGDTTAVDGIDLTVPAGTFYGLVGPNGAGKTTTLSMIAGLLRPDRGSVVVGGIDASAHPLKAKRLMGVLPDRLRTFDRLTGRQLLYYYGILRGLKPAVVESRTADLARAFDLTDALGRVVSDYSAGMTKKVMLAGALIHSPRLLVLDEPFEAVDPVSSAIILDILSAYVAHGGTVILSSHGMDLVERVCSRVAVLVAGQVLAEGTIAEVRGELTLEQRFIELAGGLSDVEGLEWLHTFSD